MWLKPIFIILQLLLYRELPGRAQPDSPLELCSKGDVRLDGGNSNSSGLIEVCSSGMWRQVCQTSWSHENSIVVCRQLGFTGAMISPSPSGDIKRASEYLHSEILCNGTETRLIDCSSREIMGDDDTRYTYFMGCNLTRVSCRQLVCRDGDVRLRGGLTSGNVEICHHERWLTLCNSSIESSEYAIAMVICRQLGFAASDAMVVPSMDFIEGGGYWPYSVNCSGTEAHLSDCSTEIMCIPIAVKCQLPEITIGFARGSDMVKEDVDTVITICVEVKNNGTLKKSITVQLDTVDGTAKDKEDYNSISHSLVFTPNNERAQQCRAVNILSDDDLEVTETFAATLSTRDDYVSLNPDTEAIFIVDNDAVNIEFIGSPFEVREDSRFVAITVGVMEPEKLKTEVSVNLTTEDIVGISNAATAGVDYRPLHVTLTFSEIFTVIIVNIALLGDNSAEGDEDFKARLSTSSESNVVLGPDTIITIVDEDSVTIGFEEDTVQFDENIGMKTLCVSVSRGQLVHGTRVSVSSQDQTAIINQDYSFQQMTFTFSEDNTRQCFNVSILDDNINEPEEKFLVILTTDDPQVTLSPDTATITILDKDIVNIVFIGGPFKGREDSGFVAITVGVMEPRKLKTEVSVNLTIEDIVGISNAATADFDYRPLDVTLTFNETVTKIVVNIELFDDNGVEGDEDFKAQLSTSSGSNVELGPDANITILDEDSVTIGFEEESVQANENIGVKTICVSVSRGQLGRNTTVSVSSQDQTAINKQDYSFQQMTFTFSKDNTRQCFNVGILDDDINEAEKIFFVMLTTSDPQVILSPDTANITILDNDGPIQHTPDPNTMVECRTESDCGGSFVTSTMKDCCDHDIEPSGFAYTIPGVEGCQLCPVDFGFSQSFFSGSEQGESYRVQVKFFSGGITNGFFFFPSLDLSGTASSSDISLRTAGGRFLPMDVLEPKDVEFSLSWDNIAQEFNETFAIVFQLFSTDQLFSGNVTIRDRLEVVIIDSDVITFQLSEVDYTQNEEPNALMEVLITKESGIQLANPVYFRVTPLTVEDALNRSVISSEFDRENPDNPISPNRASYEDFNNSVHYVEFSTDFVELTIPIVDDDIDEADEQVFIIFLEVVNATNLDNLNILENREISIGRIKDDEIIRIGFERQSYEVTEPNDENNVISNLVYLIRENNRTSEQTYSVDLTVGDPGGNYKPATIETSNTNQSFDYSFGLPNQTKVNVLLPPTVDRIPFTFSLEPDLAIEGTEIFRAISAQVTPSGDFPVFQTPSGVNAFATTLIRILDNDELKVGFEELNYTVNESDGTVEVCVVVISPPDDADLNVTVALSPSTIDGTAGAGSDFTKLTAFLSISLIFLSSPGSPTEPQSRRECFDITITNDDALENTESFSLLLQEDTFTSQTGAIISPNLTEIFILDKDEVVIGFLSESYSISESDRTVSIEFGVITGSLGTTISFNLSFSDGSALFGSDYNSSERVYSLTGRETVTVDIGIIEDDKFEHAEVFYASLSFVVVPPRVTLRPDQTEMNIIDADALIFSFRAGTYSFMENIGTGTVYVDKISGSTDVVITLRVSGVLQAGQILSKIITFNPLDSEKAITFNITDDSIALEPPENFALILTAVTIGDGLMLQPNDQTDISILDKDQLIIGFAENVSVSESENATLSITFSSAFATNFHINIGPSFKNSLLLLEIAEPDEDYFLPDFSVEAISTLHDADNRVYFDVSIIQDGFLEYEECFVAALSLPNSVSGGLTVEIAGGKDTALICIENDDRVTISFDRGMYSVGENDDIVQISASLVQGELQRPVEVLFSTLSGTATSEDPKDFQSLQSVVLLFDELLIRNEVFVIIINDNIFEDEERFFALLVTNDADVDFGDNNATITIVDDGDGVRFGFDPVQYRVSESAGSVTLFVMLLEGRLEREVNLQFSTFEGTAMASAPADYQAEARTITFSSTVSTVSISVTIFDDSILESTENFLVNLADPQSQTGVSIMPSTANVNIIDNDVVNVVFIGDPFEGREESGFVAITVGVVDPEKLKTEVSVNLTTEDIVGISNAATAGVDYRPLNVTLTFSETFNVITVNITLLNDNALEGDEDFKAWLSTNSGSNVGLGPDAIITIVDDDRVTIGFEEETLQVDESIGMKTFCVSVSRGQLVRITTVSVSSQDQTAISKQDYNFQQMTFTFSKYNTRQCFDVGILDDDINEPEKNFLAMLTTGDPQVTLSPDTATIMIIDNDERKVAVNDTIFGDLLYAVPILVDRDQRRMLNMIKPQLCYEIHGNANQWFNLVTDNCTTVNALYTPLNERLNVITKIGVKAVDEDNKCVEILVDRSQCSVNVDGTVLGMESYSSGNISVRRYSKRARISVPNCNDINLIMWVICEERTMLSSNVTGEMLKFVVLRGLNYGRRAHGLLGQFWNVPVDITPYTGTLRDNTPATDRFNINVKGIGSSSPRSFTGWLYDVTWNEVEEPCFYVGNKQAGPIHEVATPNDGVIENIFKDYKVADAFSEENYVFGLFKCPDVGSG